MDIYRSNTIDYPVSRTNQSQIASFLRKFALDNNTNTTINNTNNASNIIRSNTTIPNTSTSTTTNTNTNLNTNNTSSEVIENISIVITLSSNVIELCIKDDKSITNSDMLRSICQSIKDCFNRYNKQLNLLSSSNSIKIAIQSIITSLSTAENILKEYIFYYLIILFLVL